MSVKNLLHNLPLPPGQVIGMVAAARLGRFRAARLPGPRIVRRAAGPGLMVAGCAFISWALSERRRHAVDGFDLERPPTLVTTGPYALSRHPMYVGWWLIHLGFGVLRGSAWVFITVALAVLAEHRGVLAEERMLVQAFGPQYLNYAERVPRYVSLARVMSFAERWFTPQRATARSA
ncbi:methyltransferase family protein [Homoserinimonas sp. A520]